MKLNRHYLIAAVILIIQLVAVVWMGYSLPADTKIPVHWNIRNEVDNWASRDTAILPFWLFNLGIFLLMMFSRRISPVFQNNRERYDAVIPPMTLVLVLFFALFHIYMLLTGYYPGLDSRFQIIYLLMGALFIFLGNLLPRLPRNYVAGIKTPWTYYSDEIWRRTSRFGGFCFVILGLLMLIRGIWNLKSALVNIIMLSMLIFLAVGPVIYSFILYKKAVRDE